MSVPTQTQPATLNETARRVDVTAQDLPLACPRPGAPLWARHPKVFIDVLKPASGEAACPYCGTLYHFTGAHPKGH